MDFIFISMPYGRFISRWFANVPNINLGIMQQLLSEKRTQVKTFHFHLEFIPFLKKFPGVMEKFVALTEQFGVEYMGLDYVFASLLFEEKYQSSMEKFRERVEAAGLTYRDFDKMRNVCAAFTEHCLSRIAPYLPGTPLVGFSCSHYQLSGSLLLCSQIKELHPGIKTVFGGKDCSGSFARELIQNVPFVDFIGTGECEGTVERLLGQLKEGGKDFRNLIFRDNGNVVQSASTPNMAIDSIPFPFYDFEEFPLEKEEIILPIEFGRGCPWKRCTFCPDESYNILCQAKSQKRIESEFAYYREVSENLRSFFVLDSDALKNRDTITGLADYLQGKDLNFIYAEFRAERMDRTTLHAISRFGTWVSNFQIGIETFSERMLGLMNKGVSAMKNVEVLKAAAELNVPVQFNLFTCFPGMVEADVTENLRVMDAIAHILVSENILIFPGEFYLPADSCVFLESERFGLKKHSDSIFSLIFEAFPMPSYSNYPFPYEFENDEAQYEMSQTMRKKVEEIKSRRPEDCFMSFRIFEDHVEVKSFRDGVGETYSLTSPVRELYLSAIVTIQEVSRLGEVLQISPEAAERALEDLEQKGLILRSQDKSRFLSLAMEKRGEE